MIDGTLFWTIVFSLSALLFFGTAVVLTLLGVRDLRDLLKRSAKK